MNRRQFLRSVGLAASAGVALTACEDVIPGVLGACPDDPSESGDVSWTPDVMHPVFYGFQDLSETDGAPAVLRIWYPTYHGFTRAPPILKLCLVRYPVVLFLHGQPPGPPCPADPDYHTRWFAIPAVLAKSGYVVVVPRYSPSVPDEVSPPNASLALEILDWTRTAWSERKWVDQQPESTAVVGHSYGALLAARLVGLRRTIAVLVTLGAPWDELNDRDAVLSGLTLPKLLMWGAFLRGSRPIVGWDSSSEAWGRLRW